MKTFKDNKNQDWNIDITFGAVRRVKSVCNIDLLTLIEGGKFDKLDALLKDPFAMLGLIYTLVKDQRKEVTEDQFPDLIGGDELVAAVDAFMEEYVNFFPQPTIRESLRKMVGKSKEAMKAISAELEGEIDKVEVKTLVENLKKQSGVLQESSVSTQTPTP